MNYRDGALTLEGDKRYHFAHPMVNITNMVLMADLLAYTAHGAIDQRRKYTNEPYIVHPRAVAATVRSVRPSDLELQCAALLHDTVEDTEITNDLIRWVLGENVAELVEQVTDISRPSDGNRAVRKAIDREHLSRASARAQTLKVADLIDNSASIVLYDRTFAQTYMPEKKAVLEILTKADPLLLTRAWDIITAWESKPYEDALESKSMF